MKQQTLSDMEYSCRKKKTKREEFLKIMKEIIPWDEWVGVIRPYYLAGQRGRPPIDLELILRMYLHRSGSTCPTLGRRTQSTTVTPCESLPGLIF